MVDSTPFVNHCDKYDYGIMKQSWLSKKQRVVL